MWIFRGWLPPRLLPASGSSLAMKRLLALLPLALTAFAAPVPIFDGKTLEGWDYDPKIWRVEDGVITGGSTTEKIKANYFISTKRSYANFELRLKIKCSGDPATGMINSGIQVRSVRVPGGTHMSGYQIDCGKGWFGKIYDEYRRNRVIAEPVDAAALDKAVDVFGWNEYRIRAEGPRIQTWINGVLAIDYTEQDKNIALDGQIGPQVHSGGVCLVQVKDVTIDELPPTPGAPTWESLGGVEAARAKVAPPQKPAATPAPAKPMKEGNAAHSLPRTPAEELAAFKLPEGFEAELVAAEDPANGIGKFVPIAFDQRGALWTTTALEYPVDGNENAAAADALYASKAKDKVLVYDRDPKSPTGYASKPRVFADGLAIPLGVLPYKGGCFVQHGHDVVFLSETDAAARKELEDIRLGYARYEPASSEAQARFQIVADASERTGSGGRANSRHVILSGFGVQDSHLFPHQFLRAPGGWLWMAQGLFNKSAVKTSGGGSVPFDMCRMAKFSPDGTQFVPTSVGPNNIWGLVLDGEGEAFIQEANDYGYPVMPFHEYAYYPGGAERLAKSYQPPFPHTADFRMGGTGLSGLALTDKNGPYPEPWRDVMLVANPITNRIQAIKMHRDGPYWRLEQRPDLLVSEDPWFRPVAIATGPDGCLYIVDWYNRIISHNEVPRNHPDRDKTRGRIWRVKAKAAPPFDVPDLTKLSGEELIAKLGGPSLTQSHLAWQALVDRGPDDSGEFHTKLEAIVRDSKNSAARRIQALWVLQAYQHDDIWIMRFPELAKDPDPAIRRALARAERDNNHYTTLENAEELAPLADDPDPVVRAVVITAVANRLYEGGTQSDESLLKGIERLLAMTKGPLDGPTAPSSRGGKPIKIREAYDRDFERYLIRENLAVVPRLVAMFLDSDAASGLSVEARLLASLALEPKASASRVAKLLPRLQRAPGQEEVLRLAQFPDEPGVGEAITATLANPATSKAFLESLLAVRNRLDAGKLTPLLTETARTLLASADPAKLGLGIQLAGAFNLTGAENALIAVVEKDLSEDRDTVDGEVGHRVYITLSPLAVQALKALREMRSDHVVLFDRIARFGQPEETRADALAALASSRSPKAGELVMQLWQHLKSDARRTTLDRLASSKAGAKTIVDAIRNRTIKEEEIDGPTVEKLQTVLGHDPELAKLLGELASLFRPVLTLNGSDDAWSETGLTLDGPFTVECWVRLDPGIGNADGILGSPGQLDLNFYQAKFRVWVGGGIHDAIVSKKPITPNLWTHVAATRDAKGMFRLYQDGELVADQSKPVMAKFDNVRVAWTGAKAGTSGAISEFRLWNRVRTPEEIRRDFDRETKPETQSEGLIFSGPGKPKAGAKVAKTNDFPPVMSAAEAAALDEKFTKYRTLAEKPGDASRGKTAAMLCQACHLFKGQGASIGPDLSGVGAMGNEAILRNLLTPNAAMEAGYRIFRVELKNGDLVDAFFVSEDKDAIVVRQPGAPDRRIAKTEVRSTKYLRRSLMPDGLLDGLAPEQVSDLFAYLKTMR